MGFGILANCGFPDSSQPSFAVRAKIYHCLGGLATTAKAAALQGGDAFTKALNHVHPHPRCDAMCCSNNCLGNGLSFNTMSCYFTILICINADCFESKEHSWHYFNIFYNNTVKMQLLQI